MRQLFWIMFGAGLGILPAARLGAAPPSGGPYSVSWNTQDGGGGASSGGGFSLSGTVGQPDAGPLTGGTFGVQGGFWPNPGTTQVGITPISPLPARFVLQASPNPFRSDVHVAFQLVRGGRVELSVFDLAGRRVAGLLDEAAGPGSYQMVWHGTDKDGRRLPAGVYFLRLAAEGSTRTQRLVLLQ